jgi:hypothetical protein
VSAFTGSIEKLLQAVSSRRNTQIKHQDRKALVSPKGVGCQTCLVLSARTLQNVRAKNAKDYMASRKDKDK